MECFLCVFFRPIQWTWTIFHGTTDIILRYTSVLRHSDWKTLDPAYSLATFDVMCLNEAKQLCKKYLDLMRVNTILGGYWRAKQSGLYLKVGGVIVMLGRQKLVENWNVPHSGVWTVPEASSEHLLPTHQLADYCWLLNFNTHSFMEIFTTTIFTLSKKYLLAFSLSFYL